MNFADLRFWGTILVGFAVIFGARAILSVTPRQAFPIKLFDQIALAALGLTLLFAASWQTFVVFLCVTISTYVGVIAITRQGRRHKGWLGVLIPLQLAPLVYYKYADFLGNGVLRLGIDSIRDLAIPIGISFYTFQKIAFVCDTIGYGRPVPKPLDFLNFACFFPQIVAGPIERRDELLPAMQAFRFQWSPRDIDRGTAWMALGFFFKICLADNLATLMPGAIAGNAWTIWAANILFGLRIYFDFAGYSIIAVGIARCLGVTLTLNFASPYCSRSIAEFWRRWHITLSQWFRDYVYLPLGGNRTRLWWLNIMVVFVVSGVWHGAGWNFLIWGSMHGIALIVYRVLSARISIRAWAGWLLTQLVVFVAWLAFYETNPSVLLQKFATLLEPHAYSLTRLKELAAGWNPAQMATLIGVSIIVLVTFIMEFISLRRGNEPYKHFLRLPASLAMIVLTIILAPGEQNAFIYFAF